jgi:formate hydrogenlyase subunit 3/multisubunit Na+/H+ antiporter MnhD subunit
VYIGFSIGGVAGVMAGLAVALHHLMVKPALFYLAEAWGGSLSRLQGAGRRAPLAALLFILFALSLVGVPPLPGFWAKLLLVIGLGGEDSALAWFTLAGVLVVTVVEASYLFRLVAGFYAPGEPDHAAPAHKGWDFTRALLFGGGLVAATVAVAPLGEWLTAIAREAADVSRYVAVVLGQGGL